MRGPPRRCCVLDLVSVVRDAATTAPENAARVRLRVTGRPKGAAPVYGPSGRPLVSAAFELPLSDHDRAAVESWCAEACGAEWAEPAARVRLDLEDGAGQVVPGSSRTWSPQALTGRPAATVDRPPWVHPTPAAAAPAPELAQLGGAEAGALLQLVGFSLSLTKEVTLEAMRSAQRLASEAVAQTGQTARAQAAQLGGVTTTVAKTAEAMAADRREVEAGRVEALQAAAEQAVSAAALEAQLSAAEAAADRPGQSPRDAAIERGLGLLAGVLASGAVGVRRGPAVAPAPAVEAPAVEAPAPAVEAPGDLRALLAAGSAGDPAARAAARAQLQELGGLPALAWLAADDG